MVIDIHKGKEMVLNAKMNVNEKYTRIKPFLSIPDVILNVITIIGYETKSRNTYTIKGDKIN